MSRQQSFLYEEAKPESKYYEKLKEDTIEFKQIEEVIKTDECEEQRQENLKFHENLVRTFREERREKEKQE